MSTCQRLPRCAAVFVIASIATAALAADLPSPFLAGDFATGAIPGYFSPKEMAAAGGKIYFSAFDPDQGNEPWVSDGSAVGTRRLADLCAGECSSNPRGFAAIGDAVVFHATNSTESRAVYRLDASGAISEVATFGWDIPEWAPLGSTIFFANRDGQVYRTDGTSEGTRKVAEMHPVPSYELPHEMAAVNGAVYYADSGKLYRLEEGDLEPRPVFTFSASPPWPKAFDYTALDASRFVFSLCGPQGEYLTCRAWASDGTGAGTRSLETAAGGQISASGNFLAWRGRAYFRTYHYPIEPYYRLVSTDGTPEGTRAEAAPADYFVLFAATPSHLFFDTFGGLYARDAAGQDRRLADWGSLVPVGTLGERLLLAWGEPGGINPPRPGFTRLAVSDGTPDGSFDLREGGPESGVVFGDALYCGFYGPGGRGLLRSDGSLAGTALVKENADLPRSSAPRPFRAGSAVAVETNDVYVNGRYLYRLDPATLASGQVGDGSLGVTGAGGGRVFLTASLEGEEAPKFSYDGSVLTELPFTERIWEGGIAAADGHFFFFTGSTGALRLWESDGSAAGTRVLDELPASYPFALATSGDFVFYESGGLEQGFAVWDRARGEKRLLVDGDHFLSGIGAFPGGRALFRERIYAPEIHEVFWRTDGSAAGTKPFLDVPAAPQVIVSAVAGNRFYLALPALDLDQDAGFQGLWAGDLSDAGVRLVVPTADHRFRQLVPAGDHLYFVYDSPQGRELGFTDGSAAGTRFFDLRPGPDSSIPQALYVLADQRLVFAASGDGAGLELWISDGTPSGTYRLTDLNPGDAASSPREFLQVGGRLFFQASDGLHGRELWGIDLPPARPSCPADRLCLQNDRFAVKVTAHAPDGDFVGRRAIAGAESGVFTYFTGNNWELLVKVLDGCAVNDAFWVSAAAASDVGYTLEVEDRASGTSKTWVNPGGASSLPILDIAAFPTCELAAPEPIHSPALPPAGLAGRCDDGSPDLCLGPGGRYRAHLDWHTANGSGPALPVADGSADSGIFTFFSPSNWEMMVKVLDGCAINGNIWVFAAGTTDVGWSLVFEDRETGVKKPYGKTSGRTAPALVDLGAFACD